MPTRKKKKPVRRSKAIRKFSGAKNLNALLLSVIEHLDVFVGICDSEFMPFYCNRQGLKMVGLDSLEQAKCTPVEEWFFPEDRDFIREVFFPAVLKKGQNEVEIRFRHFKTGKPLWMMYTVYAVTDRRGKPLAYATISHNITLRKNMEERIRLDEKWQQIAYIATGMVPWEYDPGIDCFFLPPASALLLGFERGDSRVPLSRLISKLVLPSDVKALNRAFADPRPAKDVDLTFSIRLPDATIREISCQGKLFYDRGRHAMLGVFAEVKHKQPAGVARYAEAR